MKQYFPLACLSLLALVLIFAHHGYRPHHSYVQGGQTSPGGNLTTITCSPNSGSGSVTAGNMEVMAVKQNGGTNGAVSSTRVTTWTTVTTSSAGGFAYGKITSSGVETISQALGGPNLSTAVCGEYSTNTFDTTVNTFGTTVNITTTKTNADLVCTAGAGVGLAFSGGAGFTLRQTGTMATGPNGKLLLGDVSEPSAGTYACSITSGPALIVIADFYTATLPNVRRHR